MADWYLWCIVSIFLEDPCKGRCTLRTKRARLLGNKRSTLREGARNWYDRFHRHCLSLGFTTAPGDPAAYNYDRDGARGALAIHVDDALTAGIDLFYNSVIVPLLSQFSISKIEKSSFKFLGMPLKQMADFADSWAVFPYVCSFPLWNIWT